MDLVSAEQENRILHERVTRRKFLEVAGVLTASLLGATALSSGKLPYLEGLVIPPEYPPTNEYLLMPQGQDPWAYEHEGVYYYCSVDKSGHKIQVSTAESLGGLALAKPKTIWSTEDKASNLREIWAPELHFHPEEDVWSVYFSASVGKLATRRMYSLASFEPLKDFTFAGQLTPKTDRWAIDQTVMRIGDERFAVWSGWEENKNVRQNLYIAKLSEPWRIIGERAMIGWPQYPWEMNTNKSVPGGINEGPEEVPVDDRHVLHFSASGSWTDYYCVGSKEFHGSNPFNAAHWHKSPEPVFKSGNGIYGPGHGSYVNTPEGRCYVYHCAGFEGARQIRQIRYKPYAAQPDGLPDLGMPL